MWLAGKGVCVGSFIDICQALFIVPKEKQPHPLLSQQEAQLTPLTKKATHTVEALQTPLSSLVGFPS